MATVYDRSLRGFLTDFRKGWHVLLTHKGAPEPGALLVEDACGKTSIAATKGGAALPIQALSPAEQENLPVWEISRDSKKHEIVLEVRPELLRPATPAPSADDDAKHMWYFLLIQGFFLAGGAVVLFHACFM